MGLSKEILRPAEARTAFFPASASSSEIFSIKEGGVGARIREISQMLFAESKKEKEKEGQPQRETRTDGFEPFVNPESTDNPLFVNGYNGNFAQRMDLNRRGIERVLKIAHLDGKVVLTQFTPSRKSSSETQGNELVAKRFRFFGEKIEDDKENPVRRVVSTPEGWRIEINDTRIREEPEGRNLTGKKLQTEFIRQFNGQLKQGILECVWREKFSSEKDEYFKRKAFFSFLLNPTLILVFLFQEPSKLGFVGIISLLTVGFPLLHYIGNFFSVLAMKDRGLFEHHARIFNLRKNVSSSAHTVRKFDSPWEYFMPEVEVDKVARAWAFLSLKGRTLVKEIS